MKLMETLWLFSMVGHSSSMGMISFCLLSLSFQCSITNQLDDLLPVGLLAQSVEGCTERHRRSRGFEYCPNLNFFRNYKIFVYNCDDSLSFSDVFFSLSLFYNSGYHFVLLFSLEFEHIARYHHLLLIHGTSCRQFLATTATPSLVR